MGKKGGVFGKVALILGFLAFQLHMITMPFGKYRVISTNNACDDPKAADDAVLALLVIDFLVLMTCCILLFLMNFSGMGDSKIILFITMIGLFTAAVFGVIGVSIFEGCNRGENDNSGQSIMPFTTTTYISAAGFALLSGIFLIVEMCCG